MTTVEVNNLTKIYQTALKKQKVTALKDFSISVDDGTVFGLLGPNGAGKTTLVKILLGITFPTVGDAKILGKDISNYKVKERVGYLPENHKFPQYLTGGQVLEYFAELSNYKNENLNKRIDELLDLVKMLKWKKTKIKKYSKGMMQRLGLAQAMLNDPELVFLDEPTDGVDPIGRKEIRDILLELKQRGKTIFLNSHLLSEVELITDRVAILNKGELIQEGTVEDLTTSKEVYKIGFAEEPGEEFLNTAMSKYEFSKYDKNEYTVYVEDNNSLNKLIDELRQNGKLITSLQPRKSSLEDMFISLIKESDEKNNNE